MIAHAHDTKRLLTTSSSAILHCRFNITFSWIDGAHCWLRDYHAHLLYMLASWKYKRCVVWRDAYKAILWSRSATKIGASLKTIQQNTLDRQLPTQFAIPTTQITDLWRKLGSLIRGKTQVEQTQRKWNYRAIRKPAGNIISTNLYLRNQCQITERRWQLSASVD